jgi:NADH:ubiquinone oxidoreductase subunit 5 (subunit L)/multisubunit Na+/H+ antiporter MnhA subunit
LLGAIDCRLVLPGDSALGCAYGGHCRRGGRFIASVFIFQDVAAGNTFNGAVYQWLTSGDYTFEVGFLIDQLTVVMMLVVTFVSLMVHIYTIGYMQ